MKNNKIVMFIKIIISILLIFNSEIISQNKGHLPKEGFVPNKETAIKIAEAVWLPIYGDEIYMDKPFIAKLSEDRKFWIVEGTLPKGDRVLGGVPYAKIKKSDGKIIEVNFGK